MVLVKIIYKVIVVKGCLLLALTLACSGPQGEKGSIGPAGPAGDPGTPGPAGQPEVVMISGTLRIDHLASTHISSTVRYMNAGTSFTTTPICQEVESLYELGLTSGGNGAQYADNGSWVGINGAAICAGSTTDSDALNALSGMAASAWIRDGLGLIVEIDLTRLPGESLDHCSFTTSAQPLQSAPPDLSTPVYTLSSSPPTARIDSVFVRRSFVNGNSGFLVIHVASADPHNVTWSDIHESHLQFPRPWRNLNHYHLQGICAK